MSYQAVQPLGADYSLTEEVRDRGLWTIIFLLAHVPLALLMFSSSQVATAHALASIGVGLWWAIFGRRHERVAYVAAYITGAEVLWRMTGANVFWEMGKYAIVPILLVATVRIGPRASRTYLLAILYFAAVDAIGRVYDK